MCIGWDVSTSYGTLKTGRGSAAITTTLATFSGVTGRTKMASKVTRAFTSAGRHLAVKNGDQRERGGSRSDGTEGKGVPVGGEVEAVVAVDVTAVSP